MPFGIPKGAMCVQRFDDSLEFCNSHYLSHFAAFFIVARTKRSVVESFSLLIIHSDFTVLRQSWQYSAGAEGPPREREVSPAPCAPKQGRRCKGLGAGPEPLVTQ